VTDDDGRSPTSTVWFLLTLVFGFLLVTGGAGAGWYVSPAVSALAFAVSFFLFIRSGARARGR
jgi:hypothetical protein